jgi:hypothetical protein
MDNDKLLGCLGALCLAVLVVIGVTLLVAIPVWLLWNWLMPVIFELPVITFWQALGLSALCSCLLKSTNTSSSKS